ncbi:extracellular solute-binding protein [Acuticoccus kandeliae]|uniref:extracellular solute-binding protein n=1 Tax=Acuticoccus kandeliae TaxID=2073160 RepID=UPI000D3E75CA|nr:extracellular solute-binding protein [Acuticoccus kandeliae]
MKGVNRRHLLTWSGAAAALTVLPLPGRAQTAPATADPAPAASAAPGAKQHAITVFGDPLHGPDFTHFDYVNPDAPKGGEIRLLPSSWTTNQNPLTFNTFNMHILRGDSPPLMGLCHTALMVRGLNEPDAVYCHLAESVAIDGRRFSFAIRPTATFSDGSPITAEDVVFTYQTLLEKGHPILVQPLRGVESFEVADEMTAVITFAEGTSNRLPPLVATYPILSKAYYTANDFTAANLSIPVTSGPYTVGAYDAGRYVTFQRRPDYWGDETATGRGHNNFDAIRVDFFRERTASFEAFKSGLVTFREEFTSKTWATEYNFPAMNDGRVVRREFEDGRPAGAQGWFINTRRPKFADPRTREALTWAFDFEWTNANIFYGLYERTSSFFMNSDMLATGEPDAAELALLEPFRDQLDPAVFGPAWTPPVTDGTGRDREPLKKADELLRAAGWRRQEGKMVDENGQQLVIEFLYSQPTSERILQPYANRLRLLGIEPVLRLVEAAQYQLRLQNFDFDLTTQRFSFAPTPSESVREFWTSGTADMNGSYNLAGIKDPVIDALTETMLNAATREEMVTAARALDRILRLGHYWVPQYYKASHHVAYWDRFGMPEHKPRYDLPVETTWWTKAS